MLEPSAEVRRGRGRGLVRWGSAHWPVLLICGVAAALRLWRLGAVALIGDESYYWLWSERLAPAYYDNAAGVALVVRASTALGGQGEAGIRWLNALLGVGAVCLAYVLGTRLYSRRAAAIGAALLALGAPWIVVSRFVYTDALQLALLLLNLAFLAPLIVDPREGPDGKARESWRFWGVGLSMAALFNTKYNAYLYALVLLAFLFVRRRRLFSDRRTWWAMGLAACGLLPVLIWNARHDWASFGWQFQHFGTGTVRPSSMWVSLLHAVVYLTPPVALAGVLGASGVRGVRRQVLLVPALGLVLPLLLGPADSPRNLLSGLALLLLLAGDALDGWLAHKRGLLWAAIGVLMLVTGVYGVGTVQETMAAGPLPSSSAAGAIRFESAGWRRLGPELVRAARVFALDYNIAAQLRYYSGHPVQTAWGQYRLWGIPAFCGPDAPDAGVQVVALGFLDPQFVTQRLADSFEQVSDPVAFELGEDKVLYSWVADGCTVDQEAFLGRFDFMALLKAGGGA